MDCRDSERLWCVTRWWRRCSPNYWRLKRLCGAEEGRRRRRAGGEGWGAMGRGLGLSLSRQEGKHRPQASSQQISPPSRLLFGTSSHWRIANRTTGRRHSRQATRKRFSDLLMGKSYLLLTRRTTIYEHNTKCSIATVEHFFSIYIDIYGERWSVCTQTALRRGNYITVTCSLRCQHYNGLADAASRALN